MMAFFRKVYRTFIEKLNGEKVVLYLNDFNELCNGSKKHSRHPEVATHMHIVQKAIENPVQVNNDKNGKNLCYYGDFGTDAQYGGKYMKVVVGRSFYGTLVVITAHVRSSFMQNGETKLWPI